MRNAAPISIYNLISRVIVGKRTLKLLVRRSLLDRVHLSVWGKMTNFFEKPALQRSHKLSQINDEVYHLGFKWTIFMGFFKIYLLLYVRAFEVKYIFTFNQFVTIILVQLEVSSLCILNKASVLGQRNDVNFKGYS